MSDIAPRPWKLDTGRKWNPRTRQHEFVSATSDEGDGSRIVEIEAPLRHAKALMELVQCRNALILAGITPEALARDPECVKKLVEAAREHLESVARCALDDRTPTRNICQGDADGLEAALRACGIEST